MCDFPSWITDSKSKVWFATDADIKSAMEDKRISDSWDDAVGHAALEKMFGVKGDHGEGIRNIPPEVADLINGGKCWKMAKVNGWTPENWRDIQEFLAEIKTVKWFENDGKPLKKWDLRETRAAARDAARDAAWAAARDAAWDAAGDAAGAAAWAAAGAAAGDAARDAWAAGSAAWDAWDAQSDSIRRYFPECPTIKPEYLK